MKEKIINILKKIGSFFTKTLKIVKDFIVKIYTKIKTNKVVISVCKAISTALYYIFYPVIWLKKKYDKASQDKKKFITSILFITPVVIGFLVFFIYPLIMSLYYSLGATDVIAGDVIVNFGKYYETINGEKVLKDGLFQHYIYAFREHDTFMMVLAETVSTTVIDTVVIVIFSLLVAVMLNGKFRGRTFVRAVFFLPVIFNSEALTSLMNNFAQADGMLDSMGAGALTTLFNLEEFLLNVGIPETIISFLTGITDTIYRIISYSGIQILIFLSAIQSVPGHLYEAATIEGATKYEQFWKITLPMVSPMIITIVVFTVIDSFLRSPINEIMDNLLISSDYSNHAAMAWIYTGTSIAILGVMVGILSKVVFYYDDK